MQISVQQIIAKVAVKRQKQSMLQKQKQILNQINESQLKYNQAKLSKISNQSKPINQSKSINKSKSIKIAKQINTNHQINKNKQNYKNYKQNLKSRRNNTQINILDRDISKLNTTNNKGYDLNDLNRKQDINRKQEQSLIDRKYKYLKTQYNKLKHQIQKSIKHQKNYLQLHNKLQRIIKQNLNLQQKLNQIRLKKSFILQNSRQSNISNSKPKLSNRSHSNIKNSKFHNESIFTNQNGQNITKIKKRKENKQKCNDKKQLLNKNGQRTNQIYCFCQDQIKDNLNSDQPSVPLQGNTNNESYGQINNETKQSIQSLNNQIKHYQLIILQKQSSLSKLNHILHKQLQILSHYQNKLSNNQIYFQQNVCQQQGQKVGKIVSKSNKKADINNKANLRQQQQNIFNRKTQGTIIKVKNINKYQNSLNKQTQNLNLYYQQINQNNESNKLTNYHNRIIQKRQYFLNDQKTKKKLQLQHQLYSPQSQINQTSQFICQSI